MPSRILIIDPEELPRMELAIQLQEMGFEVEVAENGGEALEIFAECHPDLVISELLLGQYSGFEISSRIASDPDFACPVLLYTAFYRSESARLEIVNKYSASGYFVKPFQLPQLKKTVADILSSKREDLSGEAQQAEGEPRQEPTPPLPQTTPEPEEEPPAQGQLPDLFLTSPEGEEKTNNATLFFFQPPQAEEELIKTQPIEATRVEPTIKRSSIEPSAEEFISEIEPEGKPAQSEVPGSIPFHSPVGPVSELDEKSAPSFLRSMAERDRRYRSFPILITLALILLGISMIYLYHREFFNTLLFNPTQSSTQPPASAPNMKEAEGNGQPGSQPPLEGVIERPTEGLPSSEGAQPTSPPTVQPPLTQESGASPPGSLRSPTGTQNRASAQDIPPSASVVKITEVSGQIGPPHLRRIPRMEISSNTAKTITRPLVFRLEVSPQGKVVKSQIINESRENATLVPIVESSLSEWEFTPMAAGHGSVLVKYFSARVLLWGESEVPSR